MRSPERWHATKFVMHGARLRASREPAEVAPSSRFITNVIAPHYHALLVDHARGHLLDLGAGSVPLYGVYRDLVEAVTCVDWPQSAHSREHIDIEADLNESLPLETGKYDTVLVTDVLEHVYRPHLLIAEISRVLAPEGKLLLAVPFFYWIHEAPNDYARYTAFMLRRLCEDSGLCVRVLQETGGSPEILLDLVGKHLSWSNLLAGVHAKLAGWVVELPGVAAASRRSARWFPQGYVLVAQKP
jgi:SAM-dependent methyltransferase